MNKLFSFVLAVCAIFATASVAKADSAPLWSDDELAQFSSAIVMGQVTDLSVGRDLRTGAIYTYVTLAVDRALKGDVPERQIVLKQLGGRIGDVGLGVLDQASFRVGENVLVFAETRPRDGTLYTTALWQGKWTIDRDAVTGEAIALRAPPASAARGVLSGENARRSLSAFSSRLQASSGGARDFVAAPGAEEMRDAVSVPAPFVLFNPPWRWNEFDTGTAIPVDVQSGGQPGLSGGGFSQIQRAESVWAGPTGLVFGAGGNTNRCFGTGNFNRRVSIVFLDPCGEISDSGGTLAIGGASYVFSGGKTVNGIAFAQAVDGYIVNNDSAAALQFLQNANCFASVDTHELGHVLGLDHSLNSSAIMFATVSFSVCSAAPIPPSQDDIAGILTIYSPVGGGTAPGAPSNLTTSAAGSTVFLSWAAPATGGAPTSYIIEAGSAPGLTNLANFNAGSAATSFSAAGVPNGTYYVRIRAVNATGTSGPSNESVLVVGGGGCSAAPGAPGGLILVSKALGTVVIAWGASSGNPTSYVVEAGSGSGLANIANFDTGSPGTSLTAPNVPPGAYFVRVRGKNACGTGGPSNEIIITIP